MAYWRAKRADDGRLRIAINLRLAEPEAVARISITRRDGLSEVARSLPADGRCVGEYWFRSSLKRGADGSSRNTFIEWEIDRMVERGVIAGRACGRRPQRVLWTLLALMFAARAEAEVSIRGGKLLHDATPWVPHGVVQIAFVAPPAAQQGVFVEAYEHYSPADYAAMKQRGIDSVRIQISQPGLDPQDPLFTSDFRERVITAVHAARDAGLVVMLSVQDEAQSGEKNVAPLPNDATRRVWKSLAPVFAHDLDVMYELLNEPNLPPNPRNWQRWVDAMNATVATVRRAGARNVVVADGLLFAERLAGAPDVNDPLEQVAYASHPYAHDANGQERRAWDMKFGDFAQRHPVIVTEWATVPTYYCDVNTAAYAETFLRYLEERGIGIMAYAWDFSGPKFGSAFHGFPPQSTTFVDRACGDPGFGPGMSIERLYRGGLAGSRSGIKRP